jgi:predicted NACHT family NTPase
MDFLTGKRTLSGNLLIVSASAGVGKTTLSRHLSVELSKRSNQYKLIPAFVESQHWKKLNIGSIDELWEVIENSIRTFSPNLRISEELFEHCLKNGKLVFIFDGFDELCGHRYSQFSPNDIMQKFSDISKESNAKIILTTRTLYWESEIKEPPQNINILKLAPFNTQQAKGYYQKFFSKDASMRDRATNMYRQLIESNIPPTTGGTRVQFVNLPLCVGMIAEYVNIGGTGDLTPQSGKGIADSQNE